MTTSWCREVHPQERGSRLNTPSFSCCPSPRRQEMMLDKCSQQKNSLFPPIIESNAGLEGEEAAILYTLSTLAFDGAVLSNLCQQEMG